MSAADWQPFIPIILPALFFLGLIFGSFLNVCIYRMPQDLSIVKPRSACPHCGAPIRAYDNIPVLSWIVLRGRCRDCKAPISPRYAMVELLVAILFMGSFLRFGLTLEAVKVCTLGFFLIGLIFTDADWHLLPDGLTLTGLALGLVFSWFVPVDSFFTQMISPLWRGSLFANSWHVASLLDSLMGAAVGAAFIYGAGFVYLKWKGVEGMGFGDVKLMAMIGSFLGMRMTILIIFVAAVAGSLFGMALIFIVWRKRLRRRLQRGHEPPGTARQRAWRSARLLYRQFEIPFGSFLGSVALLMLFYGDDLARWYMKLFGLSY